MIVEENEKVIEETTLEIVETSSEDIEPDIVEDSTENGEDVTEVDSADGESMDETLEETETEDVTEETVENITEELTEDDIETIGVEELLRLMQADETETCTEVSIMEKPLNAYSTQESLLVVIAFLLAMIFIVLFTSD